VFDREAPIHELLFQEELREAIGAFAFYQSLRLGWTLPDLIIPVLKDSSEITSTFAALHECPCPELFSRRDSWEIREDLVEEEQILWLFDEGASEEELKKAGLAIGNAFPKKIYHLCLFA
jgi:hypothetical protein